jgi:hypothetical protein
MRRALVMLMTSVMILLALMSATWVGTVSLTWDPPASGTPDGYTMYRKTDMGFELLKSIEAPTVTFTDDTAVRGTNCYHVTAYNDNGESPPSNERCVTLNGRRRR